VKVSSFTAPGAHSSGGLYAAARGRTVACCVSALLILPLIGCSTGSLDFDGDGVVDAEDCDPNNINCLLESDCVDEDRDGFRLCDGDCDDFEPARFPGNTELCDGLDNDCNGETGDEEDDDGDGVRICAGDCDDSDATVSPEHEELCDAADTDCDPATTVPGDLDSDGDGDPACTDCDDSDPSLTSLDLDGDEQTSCDGDCDDDNALLQTLDIDADAVTSCDGDCSDFNPNVRPDGPELCDGVDSDCDGDLPLEELDEDEDGFVACQECNDTDDGSFPGAQELCDGVDNDCDVVVPQDEVDGDGDGYVPCDPWLGDAGTAGGDCNDLIAAVYPGAPDGCDNLDNDCNGVVDDTSDLDGDGFCLGDCDDTDPSIYPGNWSDATEVGRADSVDSNCDGTDGFEATAGDVVITGGRGLGYPVLGGVDLNGDGFDDLVAGCLSCSGASGLYAWTGGQIANGVATAAAPWAFVPLSLSASEVYLEPLPDLDGDGTQDLLFIDDDSRLLLASDLLAGIPPTTGYLPLSAIRFVDISDGLIAAASAETVQVYLVPTDLTPPAPVVSIGLASSGSEFRGVSLVPDITGDLVPELLVSWGSSVGVDVGLIDSETWSVGGTLTTSAAGVQWFWAGYGYRGLERGPDGDGDGIDDCFSLLSVTTLHVGSDALLAGPPTSTMQVLPSGRYFDYLRGGLMLLRDFDTDGFDDLAVAFRGSALGVAVVSRSSLQARLSGSGGADFDYLFERDSACSSSAAGSALLASVSAGDYDLDGKPDLVIGIPEQNCIPGAGTVSILLNDW